MSDKLLSWEEAVQWLKNQPDQQELARHCYYDDPLDQAAERFSNSEEWQEVIHLLKDSIPGKVLDLGAGRGISSYAFAKAGCSVVALEPDPSAIVGAKAIQSLLNQAQLAIEIVQEYGEQLPFPDKTFDIVYGRAVLHHARNLGQLCQEVTRVLKPGGVFIATREHVLSQKEDLEAFLNSHPLHFLYGGENAYLLSEYSDAIKSGGLNLKQTIGCFESVINYAPTNHQKFQEMLVSALERYVGRLSAKVLASSKVIQKFYGHRLSQKSNAPGRLYSFLATKQ